MRSFHGGSPQGSFLATLALAAALLPCACDHDEPVSGPGVAPDVTARAMTEPKGVLLESLTWLEAERALGPDTVVVLPVGAAAKEHGPHLRLYNDWLIAEHFKRRILERADVVVAPTLGYHHYPAFAEYPGSTSLRLETARDVVIDIVRSLAVHGPRRFYVLNTGVSTVRALEPAAQALEDDGILMRFTRLERTRAVIDALRQQPGGTHADEIETSMMLVIAPETVDMDKAVKDYDPRGLPGLSRAPDAGKCYSPSGVFGDATLATRAKGERIVEAMLETMLADIAALRAAPLPLFPRLAPRDGGYQR